MADMAEQLLGDGSPSQSPTVSNAQIQSLFILESQLIVNQQQQLTHMQQMLQNVADAQASALKTPRVEAPTRGVPTPPRREDDDVVVGGSDEPALDDSLVGSLDKLFGMKLAPDLSKSLNRLIQQFKKSHHSLEQAKLRAAASLQIVLR